MSGKQRGGENMIRLIDGRTEISFDLASEVVQYEKSGYASKNATLAFDTVKEMHTYTDLITKELEMMQ